MDITKLANAERIGYLIELAVLRRVSLRELMEQLGIKPQSVLEEEPLLKLAGAFEGEVADVGARHDEYIGEGLRGDYR